MRESVLLVCRLFIQGIAIFEDQKGLTRSQIDIQELSCFGLGYWKLPEAAQVLESKETLNVPGLLWVRENDYHVFIFVFERIVIIQNLYNNVGSNYLLDILDRIISDFWLAQSQVLRVASIDLTVSA